MFSRRLTIFPVRSLAAWSILLALSGVANVAMAATPTAPNDPPDLGTTPPDLTQSVNPNIIVTFDDSGSMGSTYMGDDRPYGGSGWDGPWRCANTIDPRVTATTNPLSRAMNGVYYNPNIAYTPPLKEDGTSFPLADVSLLSVWQDGIAVGRPVGAVGALPSGYNDNPQGSIPANNGATTNLMGQFTASTISTVTCKTDGTGTPIGPGCPTAGYGQTGTANCPAHITVNGNSITTSNCTKTTTPPASNCSGPGGSKKCYWTYGVTTTTTTDNRWSCGNVSASNELRLRQHSVDRS